MSLAGGPQAARACGRHSFGMSDQLPTTNSQLPNISNPQFPTPNLLEIIGHWQLGVGSGWWLAVGRWELKESDANCRQSSGLGSNVSPTIAGHEYTTKSYGDRARSVRRGRDLG